MYIQVFVYIYIHTQILICTGNAKIVRSPHRYAIDRLVSQKYREVSMWNIRGGFISGGPMVAAAMCGNWGAVAAVAGAVDMVAARWTELTKSAVKA